MQSRFAIAIAIGVSACRHSPPASSEASASGTSSTRAAAAELVPTPPRATARVSALPRSQADCPPAMLFVPAADPTFSMPLVGRGGDPTPQPQRFHVDAFCIDRTEVPMSAWSDSLCGAPDLGCMHDARRSLAVCIDHRQAECHCARATSGVTKRLPTDPEWLLAALGTDGRTHPWGNQPLPEGAQLGTNFCQQRSGPPRDWMCGVESNTLDQSPYGVLGLGSNGDEMTGSCYDAVRGPACVVRRGDADGPLFESRGVSPEGGPGRYPSLGFRCAFSGPVAEQP